MKNEKGLLGVGDFRGSRGCEILLKEPKGEHCECCTDNQADSGILDEARENEADKADTRDSCRIGELGGNVLDMVNVSTGRGHDGSIGNR